MKIWYNNKERSSKMKVKLTIILILAIEFVCFIPKSFADVNKAIKNARAGLNDALNVEFPLGKKYIRFESRNDGVLVYKVSIRRVDEETVKFRVTGYDGSDEVCIITYRKIKGSGYTTMQKEKQLKHKMLKDQEEMDSQIFIDEDKRGKTYDKYPTY